MSPYLFSADLGVTEIGLKARTVTSVGEALSASVSSLFAEYADARMVGDYARMDSIRRHAASIDLALVDELDGFDYLAAA
ncbi:hypothetical protein ACIQNU_04195 [Streptomyces sp. NPDC091292]|uniref:hypothetical protein n=1 Tax=Streptomyces sp. NPDC091292 TaxID=3365991 RepID=UPI003804C736